MRLKCYESFERREWAPVTAVHYTERAGKKDGDIETVKVATLTHVDPRKAIEMAQREIAADPSATVLVFADSRGDTGHFLTFSRANIDDLLTEVPDVLGMDENETVSSEEPAALLPAGGLEPVPALADAPATREPKAPRQPKPKAADVPRVPRAATRFEFVTDTIEGKSLPPNVQMLLGLYKDAGRPITKAEITPLFLSVCACAAEQGKKVPAKPEGFVVSMTSRLLADGYLRIVK